MSYLVPTIDIKEDQAAIVNWLRLKKAPGAAEAYIAALELESRSPFPGAGSLLAHCIRDLLNRIGDAFGAAGGFLDYKPLVLAIEESWEISGPETSDPTGATPSEAGPASGQSGVRIPRTAQEAVERLLAEHQAVSERDSAKFRAVLERELGPEARKDQIEPIVRTIKRIKEAAPDAAHFICTEEKRADIGRWISELRAIEQSLLALSKPFFEHLDSVDAVLEQANRGGQPSADEVKLAIAVIARPEYQSQFFQRLDNPAWIRPLQREGQWFKSAPPPIRRGSTIHCPVWPPVGYLIRMAAKPEARAALLEILPSIQDNGNSFVRAELVEAALPLAPADAATLVPTFRKWAHDAQGWQVTRRLRELARHLAFGNQVNAAMNLVADLLELGSRPIPNSKEVAPVIKAGHDAWHYVEVLDRDVASYEATLGLPLVRSLTSALNVARRWGHSYQDTYSDGSRIWRRDIKAGHDRTDVPNALVTAIVRASSKLIVADASAFEQISRLLLKPRRMIFDRILTHLVLEHPAVAVPRALLERKELFDLIPIEYQALLRARAATFSAEDKDRLYQWIAKGVDRAIWDANVRSIREAFAIPPSENPDDDDAEYERTRRQWRAERLWAMEGDPGFPTHLREELAQLMAADVPYLVKEPPRSISIGGNQVPPESDEPWTVDGVVDAFAAFSGDGSSTGRRSLSSSTVAADPQPFALAMERVSLLKAPSLGSVILGGLTLAVHQKKAFDWKGLLSQPFLLAAPLDAPDMLSMRRGVVDLLSDALQSDTQFSQDQMNEIEGILLSIFKDPVSSSQVAARLVEDDGSASLVSDVAPPISLRALVLLARRRFHNAGKGWKGLGDVPRIREALNAGLALAASRTVRALFGAQFAWLSALDEPWAAAAAPSIFPPGPGFDAGWDSFIRYSAAYDKAFRAGRAAYELAVDHLEEASDDETERREANRSLGRHLLDLYLRGLIENEPPSILARFFQLAPIPIRRAALEALGQSFEHASVPLPNVVEDRLVALWERRTAFARNHWEERDELLAFAQWFEYVPLDKAWLLDRLEESTELTESAVPAYAGSSVLERLRELVAGHPVRVMKCLKLLVKYDKENWLLFGSDELVHSILEAGVAGGDESYAHAAETIDLLGRKGAIQFGGLLKRDRRTPAK